MPPPPIPPPLTPGLGVGLWLCPRKNTPLYDKLVTLMGSVATLFPGHPPRFEPHVTVTTNIAIDLADPHDDVDRVLAACAAAVSAFGPDRGDWVTLGRVDSQRQFFKKLYFRVQRDPNLLAFARIIRELFVILPRKIEAEDQRLNSHLYTKEHGGLVKRKPAKKDKNPPTTPTHAIDVDRLQREAAAEAAQWVTGEFDPHLSLAYSDLYPIDTALWRTIKTRVQDYMNIYDCDSEDLVDSGFSWGGGVLKLVLLEGDVSDWIVLGSLDLH